MSQGAPRERRATATSAFGVGRRESHDASAFYARFAAPDVSRDETVLDPTVVDEHIGEEALIAGNAKDMAQVPTGSVALVVTSPPYFAGKQYEEVLGQGEVPGSYREYLAMLEDVFAECVRTLEPGGRIAVNVANLGRKPFRSLAGDVTTILQDRLRLLLRGEIIWQKQEGSSGSCAWGSYRSPSNPSLRDATERVIVASKGRFDRALTPKVRAARGLPHVASINADRFMAATNDLWHIPPERASRVGHPAPFPVELPEWLVELYTYEGDLVLDPFMGSGSTAVAAVRKRRRFVGYDLDPDYLDIARARVKEERQRQQEAEEMDAEVSAPPPVEVTAPVVDAGLDFPRRANAEGKAAQALALEVVTHAGFKVVDTNVRLRGLGMTMNVVATDSGGDGEGGGETWFFDVSGAFSSPRGGLRRTDTMWKALGRANVLARSEEHRHANLVLLTSHLPVEKSEGDRALRAAGPNAFYDAVAMLEEEDFKRLKRYAAGGFGHRLRAPLEGFWRPADLDRWDGAAG
ncbi:MAG TPA: site-specific DNA-methyltransferase [Acidimicrobiales bacterium]|nr:site-specific DNA-methyltransferase [Acidimicrobiales bacterium]